MTQPLIDAIIVVYNGEEFIQAAVDSALSQTWKNLNIIIVDDGSTDSTLQIVRNLSLTNPTIKVIELPHSGLSVGLNTAISHATADYVAFLDADDLWHPEKLEKQMQVLVQTGNDICFSMIREFETFDSDILQKSKARPGNLKGYTKITFLGKRLLFETFGPFNETIKTGDFVEWFSRVQRAGRQFTLLEEVLAYRRVHPSNTTLSTPKNAYLEVLKMHLDAKRSKTDA